MPIKTESDAKQRVRELVWQIKKELNIQHPPQYCGVNDPIASHLGIKVREQNLSPDDGLYLPGTPPRIALDPAVSEQERLNFTYFHEISHHLIREDDELYGFLDDCSPQELSPTLEKYCNIGAAEFLVPMLDLRQIISSQDFSIQLIPELDQQFPASKPAIAIQLAECAAHECIVLICEFGLLPELNPGQTGLGLRAAPQPCLFVRYSSSSPSCKYTSGRFVPIRRNHLLANAFDEKSAIKGFDSIPFRSKTNWSVACEALYYRGKVYAVFNITSPQSPAQLRLNF